MKKRLLSALLALALVFVLLPTTALAETPAQNADIYIAGTGWNFEKDGSTYQTVYYQIQSNAGVFLTEFGNEFGKVWRTDPYLEITRVGNDVTITVHGDMKISSNDSCIESAKSYSDAINLIITGTRNDTLTLTNSSIGDAIYSHNGDVTIKGGITVKAYSTCTTPGMNNARGIYVHNHNLTISGANTVVEAESKAAYSTVKADGGNITVSGGAQLKATNKYSEKVTSYTDKAYAIECTGALSISGENTKVTAKTSNGKQAISGTVSDGDKLTFKVQLYLASSTLYQKPMDEALGYKYVEITQAPTDPYVFIAGEPAIMGQETPIPGGSGTYLYVDAGYDGNILTLKDATINKTDSIKAVQAIRFGQNGYYTIKLEGENKISGFSSGIVAPNDSGVNNVTVVLSGSGSLDISAKQYAIDMQVGKLKFENTGKIMLTTGYVFTLPLNALRVKSGSISIDKAKYDIVGVKQDKDGTREDISDNPNLDTILKGTSTDKDLYFKSITITPAAAKDSTISYNGTTLKQGETIYGETSGTATVDRGKNTITLDNFKGDKALVFNAEFTPNSITLIGDSTLSAVETKYQSLTISGSGSLTVGSIKVHNQKTSSDDKPNLTINGATVTVGNAEITDRAIDIDGDLTVTSGSLTATSTSTKPTVQVGGNASFTGSTVTITNNSTTQGEQYKDSNAASSALHVNGAVTISGGTVMAEAKAGGNAIRAVGNITVSNDATVTAKNNSQYFNAITAGKATGGEVNTLYNLIVSGENTRITATNTHDNNLTYGGAINAYIKNANEGHYLRVGTNTKAIAPNVNTTVKNNSLTITRGDEVTRTNSPVVIAGTTLLNDTYYTINGSTVAKGSKNDYNALYDSETKTLKLNNAKISTTTKNAAIKISEDLTITVTGTNELKGNYNHCIESYNNFTINGTGTLNMTNTSSSSSAASVIWCGPYKSLTIAAEVIIKNEAQPGNLIFTVEKDAYSFAEGYNVYASTDVSGSPLEAYDAAKGSTYKYLCITKENLAPTTPTTYTVTITAGDNMNRESGALTQEVTKGAAITEVKFVAASGYYFPADYVSKMNLPAGLTAEISGNSWYLTIKGTPTSDVTINLPAASVRPTITVSMPTPVAGNIPATASDITLTYTPSQGSSRNLRVGSVIWKSYVTNSDMTITPGNTLSSGDKFVEGTEYYVTIDFEGVSEDYAIVPAAGTTKWSNAEWGWSTMTLYFDATGAPCTHQYTNDWHANGNTHWHECKLCRAHADEVAHTFGDWITDTPATDTTDGSKHRTCSVCQYQETASIPKTGTGEIVPPTPDNPGTIVIIRPAEEEKPAQQPNPSTGANDLVGMAVAAAVVAVLGSVALLRKHD